MPKRVFQSSNTRMFQSAPGREAGRCSSTPPPDSSTSSFNPRPAVRPGDATDGRAILKEPSVFQSAPGREAGRCRRAATVSASVRSFQSAPGREAGRCRRAWASAVAIHAFQSAPGREAGRCSTLVTCGFACGFEQGCAKPGGISMRACEIFLIRLCKFLKNSRLPMSRFGAYFMVTWGSRVIRPAGLRNRLSGSFRIV